MKKLLAVILSILCLFSTACAANDTNVIIDDNLSILRVNMEDWEIIITEMVFDDGEKTYNCNSFSWDGCQMKYYNYSTWSEQQDNSSEKNVRIFEMEIEGKVWLIPGWEVYGALCMALE